MAEDKETHADKAQPARAGRRFAVAVIVNARAEILFLKRSRNTDAGPGQWGFPGGKLLPGEDPETGMLREMREELGERINVQEEARLGPVPAEGFPGSSIHLFRYRWLGGLVMLNEEHTRFAWVDAAGYPSLDVMRGIDSDLAYFGLWR